MTKTLRRGFTTGACATAAASAAFAVLKGKAVSSQKIVLPSKISVDFPVAFTKIEESAGMAGVIKDAGDDPDVTDGVCVIAKIRELPEGRQNQFMAGEGVGTVTLPGLPISVGEAAINPVPRRMIIENMQITANALGVKLAPLEITLSIPNGKNLAQKTLNPRLGIMGGLSILGTTGIVVPYSCSAWIDSIYSGINVARAGGISHIIATTGKVSEEAMAKLYGLPAIAFIEMGDFVGAFLKYIAKNPVNKISIGGGLAKMCKLAQGKLNLHSKYSTLNREFIAKTLAEINAPHFSAMALASNTLLQVWENIGGFQLPFAKRIAELAYYSCINSYGKKLNLGLLEICLFDRQGNFIARYPGEGH